MTHDDVWHALPFFVNGTLRGRSRADVDSHLADCAECRAEVEMQTQVRDAIAVEDVREETTQSSFDELWERITDHEAAFDEHARAAVAPGKVVAPAVAIATSAAPAVSTTPRAPAGGMLKWLVAAVIVEGVGLVTLGAMSWNTHIAQSGNADYRTLSTPAAALPPGQIRAVFAPELELGNLQTLLSGSRLSIVDGPTEAGVYTLALDDSDGSVDSALAGLRRSPSVRFAEPIEPPRAHSR
ncbi:MAG: zf-HC2 domain-containing protein [Gammaproteobacteria bacterium]